MLKRAIQKLRILSQPAKGQSLVEMAIVTPILIFMLMGLFEVGAVLRGYLVLANVSREITRFAVRPGYLDFSTEQKAADSYKTVRDWVHTSLSDQLELDFDPVSGNATLIISHVVADTGLPCEDIYENPGACDCNAFITNPNYSKNFTLDDLIIHAGKGGMEFQTQRFGPAMTETGARKSLIDYEKLIFKQLAPQNNRFNCEIIKKGGLPSASNVVITELFFDQPQLFGFPVISNPYTDPIPLYAHTTMRLTSATRSTGVEGGSLTANIETLGPVCDAYPFTIHQSALIGQLGQRVDIFGGPGGSDFGWLAWNPDSSTGSQSSPYLRNELKFSTMALNDFVNARDPSDVALSVGDYVASISGVEATAESSHHLVSALIGKKIRIPVWDTFVAGTGGERDAYHIPSFAWVRIEATSDINLPGKTVYATYLGDASEACSASSSPATNQAPLAMDDTAITTLDTAVTINVLNNDGDPDGDTVTVDHVGTAGHGNVVNNGNGTITYTPSTGYSGGDTFSYTISDGNGGTDTAVVIITINATPGNNPPVATDDSATTEEDTAITLNVLANDSDPDGDSFSIVSVAVPSNGNAVDNGDGTVTYTPNAGFSGTANFTYVISDGKGGMDTAIVTVTVNATNVPPVAVNDGATTTRNNPVIVTVLSNDSDPDGDLLTIVSVGTASHGNVVSNGDGTLTYTPDTGYSGPDSFTYTISDGNGGTATATVTVTVAAPVCTETEIFADNFGGSSLNGAKWDSTSGTVSVSRGYVSLYKSSWGNLDTVTIDATGYTDIKLLFDLEMVDDRRSNRGEFYVQVRQKEAWGWDGWSKVGSTLYEPRSWSGQSLNLPSKYENKEIKFSFKFRRDEVHVDNVRLVGTTCQ